MEGEQGGGMQVGAVLVLLDKANATGAAENVGKEAVAAVAATVRVEKGVRWGGGIFSMLALALLLASPFQINPPEERERESDGVSSF